MNLTHEYRQLLIGFRQSSQIILFCALCFLLKWRSKSRNSEILKNVGIKVTSLVYQNISKELVWSLRGLFHVSIAAWQIVNFYNIKKVAKNISVEKSELQNKIYWIAKFSAIAVFLFSIRALVLLKKNYKEFCNLLVQTVTCVVNIVISFIFQKLAELTISFIEGDI